MSEKRTEPFMPKVNITVEMDSHEMGTVLMEKIAQVVISRMSKDEYDRIVNGVIEIVHAEGDKIVEQAAAAVNEYFTRLDEKEGS